MKKLIFISTFLCLSTLHSQTIDSEKVFGGYKYKKDGKMITMSDMVYLMKPYPEAHELMKKAKSNNAFATVFGFIGGGLIGWPIGTALGGGEPNWILAGIGAVAIGIGIPFSISANKKTNQAIEIYNSNVLPSSEDKNAVGLRLFLSGSGFGLSLSF